MKNGGPGGKKVVLSSVFEERLGMVDERKRGRRAE